MSERSTFSDMAMPALVRALIQDIDALIGLLSAEKEAVARPADPSGALLERRRRLEAQIREKTEELVLRPGFPHQMPPALFDDLRRREEILERALHDNERLWRGASVLPDGQISLH